jgi:hypothetical protein
MSQVLQLYCRHDNGIEKRVNRQENGIGSDVSVVVGNAMIPPTTSETLVVGQDERQQRGDVVDQSFSLLGDGIHFAAANRHSRGDC